MMMGDRVPLSDVELAHRAPDAGPHTVKVWASYAEHGQIDSLEVSWEGGTPGGYATATVIQIIDVILYGRGDSAFGGDVLPEHAPLDG